LWMAKSYAASDAISRITRSTTELPVSIYLALQRL
jgi:hypothetical protein